MAHNLGPMPYPTMDYGDSSSDSLGEATPEELGNHQGETETDTDEESFPRFLTKGLAKKEARMERVCATAPTGKSNNNIMDQKDFGKRNLHQERFLGKVNLDRGRALRKQDHWRRRQSQSEEEYDDFERNLTEDEHPEGLAADE